MRFFNYKTFPFVFVRSQVLSSYRHWDVVENQLKLPEEFFEVYSYFCPTFDLVQNRWTLYSTQSQASLLSENSFTSSFYIAKFSCIFSTKEFSFISDWFISQKPGLLLTFYKCLRWRANAEWSVNYLKVLCLCTRCGWCSPSSTFTEARPIPGLPWLEFESFPLNLRCWAPWIEGKQRAFYPFDRFTVQRIYFTSSDIHPQVF